MKTTIGVFFGGRSVEHEISVVSALQAIEALDKERYDVIPVYITKQGRWLTGKNLLDTAAYRDMPNLERKAKSFDYKEIAKRLDVAIPVLHGTGGEDGTFQGLLEMAGIPYVGCGVLASAVGMDKIAMKMMLSSSGLPVIDYVWFTDREWSRNDDGGERNGLIARIEERLGFPVIVKPANLGSSVGISCARDRQELLASVEDAMRYSSRLLVERMVSPLREINCSVLGSADECRASVCEEPVGSGEILSYADKYLSGGKTGKGGSKAGALEGAKVAGSAKISDGPKIADGPKVSGGMSSLKRRLPADLPEETTAEIQRLALETFRILGCDGVARIDFILDGSQVYVNEINTIPGSLSFYLWEATGLSFNKLMDTLISGALRRSRLRENKTQTYDQNIFNL